MTAIPLRPQVKIWFQNRRARERRDHESRARTTLPVVSCQTVQPSTPSPTVLHSSHSAFHPVLAAAAATHCPGERREAQDGATALEDPGEEPRH